MCNPTGLFLQTPSPLSHSLSSSIPSRYLLILFLSCPLFPLSYLLNSFLPSFPSSAAHSLTHTGNTCSSRKGGMTGLGACEMMMMPSVLNHSLKSTTWKRVHEGEKSRGERSASCGCWWKKNIGCDWTEGVVALDYDAKVGWWKRWTKK